MNKHIYFKMTMQIR